MCRLGAFIRVNAKIHLQVAGSVLRLGIHKKARGFWFLKILVTTTLQYVTRTSGTEGAPRVTPETRLT